MGQSSKMPVGFEHATQNKPALILWKWRFSFLLFWSYIAHLRAQWSLVRLVTRLSKSRIAMEHWNFFLNRNKLSTRKFLDESDSDWARNSTFFDSVTSEKPTKGQYIWGNWRKRTRRPVAFLRNTGSCCWMVCLHGEQNCQNIPLGFEDASEETYPFSVDILETCQWKLE